MSTLTLDAEALYLQLREQLRPLLQADTALIGVWSGGAHLAERLVRELGHGVPAGVINSVMHRDDYAKRGLATDVQPTKLPFEVNGRDVLLIDDVLYTGRTTRAVLNELFDFGRPSRVRLVVLVDRGGRELPIEPTLCAARVQLQASQRLSLSKGAEGRFHFDLS